MLKWFYIHLNFKVHWHCTAEIFRVNSVLFARLHWYVARITQTYRSLERNWIAKLRYVAMKLIFATGHCLIKPDQTSLSKTSNYALPECVAIHYTFTFDFYNHFSSTVWWYSRNRSAKLNRFGTRTEYISRKCIR